MSGTGSGQVHWYQKFFNWKPTLGDGISCILVLVIILLSISDFTPPAYEQLALNFQQAFLLPTHTDAPNTQGPVLTSTHPPHYRTNLVKEGI